MKNPFPPEHQVKALDSFNEVKPNSFIFERANTIPADWCQEIVKRFEQDVDSQKPGRIGQTQSLEQEIKKTTDLVVSDNPKWKDVDNMLFRCMAAALQEFRETYPFFKGPFKDMGYQIQRYLPGEFYHWHIDGGSHEFSQRQLVAIWYLNDVEGPGGETEFLYQDVSIKPEQGKMVLFPPFWTHEHRAAELKQGVKYMATTWVVFA